MSMRGHDLIQEALAQAVEGYVPRLAVLKGETLVVTGGTGFMGTWLAELVAHLNDAHGFGTSLHLMARSTAQFEATRPHLARRPDVRLIKADVRHAIEVPRETNWLIHAAATPDSRFHSSSPIETMSAIAEGTSAMLRAADRCADFKMFLNVSSGLVYGAQPLELERMPESFAGAPPSGMASSAYAEAKRYAETLCAAARSQARIPVVTARPFAFAGPYQSLETPWAINNFLRDALAGRPIRVLGDGQTVRSYMFPSDMAVWLLAILTGGRAGEAYNVGSPEPVRLEQLAELVSSHVGRRVDVLLSQGAPAAQASRSRLVPDTNKAEGLGLRQTVDLAQSIQRTVRWHQLHQVSTHVR